MTKVSLQSISNNAICLQFKRPEEEKLEDIFFKVTNEPSEFICMKALKAIRESRHTDSNSIKKIIDDHGIEIAKKANGCPVKSPYRRLSRALQKEKSANAKRGTYNSPEVVRARMQNQGQNFRERLEKNEVTIREGLLPNDDLTNGLNNALAITVPAEGAITRLRMLAVLRWLHTSYFPLIQNLHTEIKENNKARKEDEEIPPIPFLHVRNAIATSIRELDPELEFDFRRFGEPDSPASLHNLHAMSQAISEEIAIPNKIYFKLNPESFTSANKHHYIGAVLNNERVEISPNHRCVHIIKTKCLQGNLINPELTSFYVVLENAHENQLKERRGEVTAKVEDHLHKHATNKFNREDPSRVRLEFVDSTELLAALVGADAEWSTELFQGRRLNDQCRSDIRRLHTLGLKWKSRLARRIRETKNPGRKIKAAEHANFVRNSLVRLINAEDRVPLFFELIANGVDSSILRDRPIVPEVFIPKGLEEAVNNYIELSDTPKEAKDAIDMGELLVDLSKLKIRGRRYIRNILNKHGVKVIDPKKLEKRHLEDPAMLPIVRSIFSTNSWRIKKDNAASVHVETYASQQLVKTIAKFLDPSLRGDNGRIDSNAWHHYLIDKLCKSTSEATEAAVAEFGKELKLAALDALDHNFEIETTFDINNNAEWMYENHEDPSIEDELHQAV